MKTSSTILFSFCVVNLIVFAENGSFPLLAATNWLSPNISKSSCSFHLARCFFFSDFCEKKSQCETMRKHQQGRGRIFFHTKSIFFIGKVGEFMKLSYACEDING